MIHHISIPVRVPRAAADVLAQVLVGRVAPFGEHDEVWTVRTDDEFGTAIECFPSTLAMAPSDVPTGVDFVEVAPSAVPTAVHALISVPCPTHELLAIAATAGWRAEVVARGPRRLVALWVENSVLLEVVTPDLAGEVGA